VLILSRKKGESFFIGEDIEVFILEVQNDKIRVGINAPSDIKIARKELKDTEKANLESAFCGHITPGFIKKKKILLKKL
jgi:carbon storage regulator